MTEGEQRRHSKSKGAEERPVHEWSKTDSDNKTLIGEEDEGECSGMSPSQRIIAEEERRNPPVRVPPSSPSPAPLAVDPNRSHAPLPSSPTDGGGNNQAQAQIPAPTSFVDPHSSVHDVYTGYRPTQFYPASYNEYNHFYGPLYQQTSTMALVNNVEPVYMQQSIYQYINQSRVSYGWPDVFNLEPFYSQPQGYFNEDGNRGTYCWENACSAPHNDPQSSGGAYPVIPQLASMHEGPSPYAKFPDNQPNLYFISIHTGLKWPKFEKQVRRYQPLNLAFYPTEATTWIQQHFEQYKALGADKCRFRILIDFQLNYADWHDVPIPSLYTYAPHGVLRQHA